MGGFWGPLPWCGHANSFIRDLDRVSVRDSIENHTFQAGKFEKHLGKGLFTCGHALREPIRDSTESHCWHEGLRTGEGGNDQSLEPVHSQNSEQKLPALVRV